MSPRPDNVYNLVYLDYRVSPGGPSTWGFLDPDHVCINPRTHFDGYISATIRVCSELQPAEGALPIRHFDGSTFILTPRRYHRISDTEWFLEKQTLHPFLDNCFFVLRSAPAGVALALAALSD